MVYDVRIELGHGLDLQVSVLESVEATATHVSPRGNVMTPVKHSLAFADSLGIKLVERAMSRQ
jgi:hypothetical protein